MMEKFVFGCANFGGFGSNPSCLGLGNSEPQAFELLDYALEIGITSFDTANTYANGESERILGKWLKSKPSTVREPLTVATKVGNAWGQDSNLRSLSKETIQREIEQSLMRLQIDTIDLYWTHLPDPKTPVSETVEALESLISKGKIRSYGASNVDQKVLNEYLALTSKKDTNGFHAIQNSYSLLERSSENLFCHLGNLKFFVHSPLFGGLLTGKYDSQKTPSTDTRAGMLSDYYQEFFTPQWFEKMSRFKNLAHSLGHTCASLSYAYLLSKKEVSSIIIGPKRKSHFEDIVSSARVSLTGEQIQEIESIFKAAEPAF